MILSIILGLVLLISIFININLLRKVERVDDELLEKIDFDTNLQKKLREALDKMKVIDSKGWFEKDDETGTVFNNIKDTINTLQDYYQGELDNESVDE